jgi:hypothetical protein
LVRDASLPWAATDAFVRGRLEEHMFFSASHYFSNMTVIPATTSYYAFVSLLGGVSGSLLAMSIFLPM